MKPTTKHPGRPGYHDITIGDAFKEIADRPRIVEVVECNTYFATVRVMDGRGHGKVIQKPRKQLADPVQWKYLDRATGEHKP